MFRAVSPPFYCHYLNSYKRQSLLDQFRVILTDPKTHYQIIEHISFDVFGFSRGAALARHFVNAALAGLPDYTQAYTDNEPDESINIYPNLFMPTEGEPDSHRQAFARDTQRTVNVRFVGLLDTVGSFYFPGNHDEGNFNLHLAPDCAEKVVQLCAAHEYRKNFPLTSIFKQGESKPENFFEEVFPGCHTDVGGGYPSKQQYNKPRLPKRYGMPIQDTYNLELVKFESFDDEYRRARSHLDSKLQGRYNKLTFLQEKQEDEANSWQQYCQKHYQQYGEVKVGQNLEGENGLLYYRLPPISNALSGLTQERLKQQAEKVGVEWDINHYPEPKDFTGNDKIQTLWAALANCELGSITPEQWNKFTTLDFTRLEDEGFIHHPHDKACASGYDTLREKLVSDISVNAQGQPKRNIFDNE